MPEKPDLAALIAAQAAGSKSRRRRSKAAIEGQPQKSAPPVPVEQKGDAAEDKPAAELVRELLVRRFVTAFVRENLNASAALRSVRPDVSKRSSRELAHRLLESPDVRAELLRQLRSLSTSADLDGEWCFRQWRSMAHANIFDYVDIDPTTGKVLRFKLDPNELPLEMQLNVRRLKLDATGRVVDIELVDRQGAVESVAKARRMFYELEQSDEHLAQAIAERMQRASKLLPRTRTFDGETGEEIE